LPLKLLRDRILRMLTPEIGESSMKRSVLGGLSLASLALCVGLAGCGGGGIDEGVPRGDATKPDVPLDTISTGMLGRTAKDMGKAAAKAKEAAKADAAAAPAEKKE